MKKILVCAIVFAGSLALNAQNLSQVNLDSLVNRELDSMTVRLGLSPEQRAGIGPVQQNFYTAVRSLPANLSLDARGARIDSLGQQRDQSLQTLLTQSQWTAHQSYLTQRRQEAQQAIEERRNRHRQQSQHQ